MDHNEAVARVKEVITSLFDLGLTAEQIRDDAPIFDAGIGLDSMAAVELLDGLEARFQIVFDNEDLSIENFGKVSAVARLICRKLVHGGTAAVMGQQPSSREVR
jgi:acyl carrier protein